MLDHVSLAVADLPAATIFYERALAPLGVSKMYELDGFVAFGKDGEDDFAIHPVANTTPPDKPGPGHGGAHVAFTAANKDEVDSFYAAAMEAGAESLLAPATHPEYHAGYYGAFVFDAEGNNIEAVYHGPGSQGYKPMESSTHHSSSSGQGPCDG